MSWRPTSGPAFDEVLPGRHYEGLVYFTDGRGDMPAEVPGVTTLWVITHDDPFLAEFRTIVRLSDLERR